MLVVYNLLSNSEEVARVGLATAQGSTVLTLALQ